MAEVLAALVEGGFQTSGESADDPHALVWELLLKALGAGSMPVRLARLLAWCPPLPVDVTGAPVAADADAILAAVNELARLQFVAPIASTIDSAGGRGDDAVGRAVVQVQLHRLFAEAIRNQTWRSGGQEAMGVLRPLLISPWGHATFIESAEQTALSRLDQTDLARATEGSDDPRSIGLVWQGLGHIRGNQSGCVVS